MNAVRMRERRKARKARGEGAAGSEGLSWMRSALARRPVLIVAVLTLLAAATRGTPSAASAASPPEGAPRYDARVELGDLRGFFDKEASIVFWAKVYPALPLDHISRWEPQGRDVLDIGGRRAQSSYPRYNSTQASFGVFRESRVGIPLLDHLESTRQWHFIAITTEPGEDGWKFYLNGKLLHQSAGEDAVSVGARSALAPQLDGYLADVRLYRRVLTRSEIADLMSGREMTAGMVWPMWRAGLDRDRSGRTNYRAVSPGERVTLGPVEFCDPRGAVTYQWYLNDQPIADATKRSLTIHAVAEDHLGAYCVRADDDRHDTPAETVKLVLVKDVTFDGLVRVGGGGASEWAATPGARTSGRRVVCAFPTIIGSAGSR